jgi:predicted HD phosphohydrolase
MYYYSHHFGEDRNIRERFKDSPWYQDAIDFCHNYDQNCFDPDYDSESLEFFEPMMRRVMSNPHLGTPS